MSQPLILAIDTSCDETCAAVSHGRKILSNVISSQINIHSPYGGVVPNLAKRAHQDKIDWVVRESLKRSHLVSKQETTFPVNAIAVTIGPGLAPALEVGVNFAKNLALKYKKPLIAINHLEGHLLSSLALPNTPGVNLQFPALGLIASGGHTQLILVKKIGSYQLLGETLDDAAGESLDKLAKMLKLGYPGGPIIEKLAKLGNPDVIPLPIPMQHSKDFNFSFSGLKTAAMYKIKTVGSVLTIKFTQDMAASFQQAITKSLTIKLQKAIDRFQPKSILIGGGVFSNLYFRSQIRTIARKNSLPFHQPYSQKLFTDNAAMIAVAASFHFNKGESFVKNIHRLDRQPNLNFTI
ncbi:MAG: tRNA (adenosine(37)-N6)-threonylcarbamoyltransferase complex transferase subunit TsaD [Patescibacteria group bacterium]|nr:tRNA (adenosine(37)-N6)-threonylcarbamoyltransferase complex transferase subunit TsaD [Patescibacteria group bacterium]